MIDALGPDRSVVVHASYACPFSSVTIPSTVTAVAATCEQRNDDGVALVRELSPELVFIGDSYRVHEDADGQQLSASAWAESVGVAIGEMQGAAAKVVLVSAPPAQHDLGKCYTPTSVPSNCITTVSEFWKNSLAADGALADSLGATLLDTKPLFCVGDYCPPISGGIVTKSDAAHMTIAYGERIVPALRELLVQAALVS